MDYLGADAVNHMSEEIKDASIILPKSIMWSYYLNGALGLIMLVTFCYCFGPLTTEDSALNSPTKFPFITVFKRSTGSKKSATAMASVIIVLSVCGCISNIASASRSMFAFARDKGLPYSSFLAHVSQDTSTSGTLTLLR